MHGDRGEANPFQAIDVWANDGVEQGVKHCMPTRGSRSIDEHESANVASVGTTGSHCTEEQQALRTAEAKSRSEGWQPEME